MLVARPLVSRHSRCLLFGSMGIGARRSRTLCIHLEQRSTSACTGFVVDASLVGSAASARLDARYRDTATKRLSHAAGPTSHLALSDGSRRKLPFRRLLR